MHCTTVKEEKEGLVDLSVEMMSIQSRFSLAMSTSCDAIAHCSSLDYTYVTMLIYHTHMHNTALISQTHVSQESSESPWLVCGRLRCSVFTPAHGKSLATGWKARLGSALTPA